MLDGAYQTAGVLSRNDNSRPVTNCYCTTDSTYSYYMGSRKSQDGRVEAEELKGYASQLGTSKWSDDINFINNGYPVLLWEIQ